MDDDRSSTETAEAAESPDHGEGNPEALPRFGRSWLWLPAFIAVHIAGLFFYGVGYAAYLALSDAPRRAEFENLFAEHLMTPSGITGAYTVTAALVLLILLYAADFRQQPWQQTLALKTVPLKAYLPWLGLLVVYFLAAAAFNMVMSVEPGEFVESIAGTQHLGLLVTMVVLAPVVEELVFRGYLYKAWRQSLLGRWGTLLLTSVLFALLHAGQYDPILLWQLTVIGLLLGFAREKTGSVYVPIALHSLNNLVSWFFIVYLGLH